MFEQLQPCKKLPLTFSSVNKKAALAAFDQSLTAPSSQPSQRHALLSSS